MLYTLHSGPYIKCRESVSEIFSPSLLVSLSHSLSPKDDILSRLMKELKLMENPSHCEITALTRVKSL